jgi:hypothetical protein
VKTRKYQKPQLKINSKNMSKVIICFFILLGTSSISLAQKTSVYLLDFNTTSSYALTDKKEIMSKQYLIAKIPTSTFFSDVANICDSMSAIPDSVVYKELPNINYWVRLVFSCGHEKIVLYEGKYFKYKDSFYLMNCSLYDLYIGLIPFRHTSGATPGYLSSLDCRDARRLKFKGYPTE